MFQKYTFSLRCNNRNTQAPCRAGIYPGYVTAYGHVIFDDDVFEREVLITSDQTGFDISYLNELIHRVQRQNITFESEAEVFNSYHIGKLPFDVMERRKELDRRRIADAYYLITYLEMGSRYGLKDYQVIYNGDLEETILMHKSELKLKFEERWTIGHKCDVVGCSNVLVIDGGLTPHRSVCAAKLSGMKVFEEAGISYLTGCPKMPINASKFCHDHENCDTPIMAAKELTDDSRKKLRSHKSKEAQSEKARDDDFFVIESVAEIKEEDGKSMFLVKWVGYPNEENTWEPKENIPGFIQKYYEDRSKVGQKLPAPTIKYSKTIGGVKYHYLKWGAKDGDWLSEEFFQIIGDDGDIVDTHEPLCNTRKSRDKRVKQHTVGLLLGSAPCGIVRLLEELFGSEAISQVYGCVAEYLGKLPTKELEVLGESWNISAGV